MDPELLAMLDEAAGRKHSVDGSVARTLEKILRRYEEKRQGVRLKIRHNMEIAHRLSKDTTKCKQIHGHGMQVELVFVNLEAGELGMARTHFGQTLEFGSMKRSFRNHIDSTYDHRLVLNQEDPFAGPIFQMIPGDEEMKQLGPQIFLPGLSLVPDEPTVENLAKWIAQWAADHFKTDVICRIDETKTNGAEVFVTYTGTGTKVMQ